MNKKKKNLFVPFTHDELELKNALVQMARNLKNRDEFESKLASAMIYASVAEYLASHLLENLRYFSYKSMYVNYAGILFIDERSDQKPKTLGNIKSLLEKYQFPDRDEVVGTIQEISECRNDLFHNLARTSTNDFHRLEEEIKIIQDQTEIFIEKINVVYSGLQKILIPISSEEDNGATS